MDAPLAEVTTGSTEALRLYAEADLQNNLSNPGRAVDLLDEAIAFCTRPEYVYSHAWQVGDMVIWDNRCLLHRGSGYDADKYRRRMRQTRVQGAGPTLQE